MHTNRLAQEKSPYLLQHAHNPVDWYPWGPEAFDRARRLDLPIFLSVGYSTCHWCHVMERESFEDEGIAALLNQGFVPVKVDREERPDVDRVYMHYVQATTGSGGWPMSVWLTPGLEPFYGGTYFPPDNRYGRPGFRQVLERIRDVWQADRGRVIQSGQAVLGELRRLAGTVSASPPPDAGLLERGFLHFRREFDPVHGGFGGAPKFPQPSILRFLLREQARMANNEALDMVLSTLRVMACGGIHDHLGGGFHRYSVDERWFVPHFEKMLYDQAQLATACLEAYLASGREFLATVARGIFAYVLRDMTAPEGGFYSAEDADSVIDPATPEVKGEGAFYVWSRNEIEALLGAEAGEFCRVYGVAAAGNVVHDPQGEFTGKNILSLTAWEDGAELAGARRLLREARQKRVRPHLDDKILTGWNGLTISALALGSRVLGEPAYLAAANRAADFVLEHLWDAGSDTLLRRYRDGEAAVPAFSDDYSFLVQALLDLNEAGTGSRYLDQAVRLTERQLELFEDRETGGLFTTAKGDETLVLRLKDDHDGAEPSSNSVAALNLLRLAAVTGRAEFRAAADQIFRAFSSHLNAAPASLPMMLVALGVSLSGAPATVCKDFVCPWPVAEAGELLK